MMTQSLFEKIGGEPAVDAAVDLFYRKVLNDARVSRFFDDVDMDGQSPKQKAFLTRVFAGPDDYTRHAARTARRTATPWDLSRPSSRTPCRSCPRSQKTTRATRPIPW